jgi:hypothetical protein
MLDKSLKNESHPKAEGKCIVSDPHPIIISKGFTIFLKESIIVFLFIPD